MSFAIFDIVLYYLLKKNTNSIIYRANYNNRKEEKNKQI